MTEKKHLRAAPQARILARELGINLVEVTGTGRAGAIKVSDVQAHAGVSMPSGDAYLEKPRGKMNYMMDGPNDGVVERGGMRFKKPQNPVLDGSLSKKLDIPQKYLDNGLKYRWVTDDGGRVAQLRERYGYETVPEIVTPTGDIITTRRHTGMNKDNSLQYQQLMAIPEDWYNERKAADNIRICEKMKEMSTTPHREEGMDKGKEYYVKSNTRLA